MPCLPPEWIKRQFGICPDQPLAEALMGRLFPVAGSWWRRPTSTAMATRTMCSITAAPVEARYGILATAFLSAPLGVQLFRAAGAWWVQLILIATAIGIISCSIPLPGKR